MALPEIEKQLNKARPRLFRVAPLTATICWIYVVINFFVFYSMFFIYRPITGLILVNDFLSYQVWGILFLFLGCLGAYELFRNNWNGIRRTLLIGVIIKMAWEITLIVRTFQSPETTILTTVLWGFFALVQAATYIYFMPEITVGRDNEQQ